MAAKACRRQDRTEPVRKFPSPQVPQLRAEAGITGPRWIAESVAVALEESAPTLEQEMELAAAAKVAAEAARNDLPLRQRSRFRTSAPVVEAVEAGSRRGSERHGRSGQPRNRLKFAVAPAGCRERHRRSIRQLPKALSSVQKQFRERLKVARASQSRERRIGVRGCRSCRFQLGTCAHGGSSIFHNRFARDIRERGGRKRGSRAAARSGTGRRLAKLEADT